MNISRLHQKYMDYLNSDTYSIEQCYRNASQEKREIFRRWITQMCVEHGYSMRIVSHNSHMFTLGYIRPNCHNGETFVYVTKTGTHTLRIS